MTKLEAIRRIICCGYASAAEKVAAIDRVLCSDESKAEEIAAGFLSAADVAEQIISAGQHREPETHNHPQLPPSPPTTGMAGQCRDIPVKAGSRLATMRDMPPAGSASPPHAPLHDPDAD